MEEKYFKNQLRGYNVVLGVLRAQSEDKLCGNCIGLEGAITKVEKGLKKMNLDLADLTAPEEDKNRLMGQIDQLNQQVRGIPIGEEST